MTTPHPSLARDTWVAAAIGAICLLFAAGAYLPDVGRGFIKDDFGWVIDGTVLLQHPLRAFTGGWDRNFFRPMVGLSFGVDHALYGLWARGYGLTNLTLYIACILMIAALGVQFKLSRVGSAAAALAWAVNPNGVDMSVLWLSGRTSLLMTLFSCLSLLAVARRRRGWAALFLGLAVLSKEDAVAIPLLVLAIGWFDQRPRHVWMSDGAVLTAVVGGYLLLRAQTHAISLATAPPEYQLTWNAGIILTNVLHYVDRAATSTAVLMVLVALAARRGIRWRELDRRWIVLAAVWFAIGICITARIPVRSSLYIVFAAIGPALVFGHAIDTMRAASATGSDTPMLAVFASVLLLIPAVSVRTDRWVEPARVSTRALTALARDGDLSRTTEVVFRDEPSEFSNFEHGLAGAERAALLMLTGRDIPARIVRSGDGPTPVGAIEVRLSKGSVSVSNMQRGPRGVE